MDARADTTSSAAEAALHRLLLGLLAALALAGLAPLFAAGIVYRFFHSGLVFALAAAALTGALLPALLALRAARRVDYLADGAGVLALWGVCLTAALAALASVTLLAQTLLPWLVVQAQRNTHPYALTQPLALLVFVFAVALALDRRALASVVPWPRLVTPVASVKALAAGLIVAVWFLEGGAGPHPGPAWLVVKTLGAAAAVLAVARIAERIRTERRLMLAWVVALAGVANVLVTLGVLARQGAAR